MLVVRRMGQTRKNKRQTESSGLCQQLTLSGYAVPDCSVEAVRYGGQKWEFECPGTGMTWDTHHIHGEWGLLLCACVTTHVENGRRIRGEKGFVLSSGSEWTGPGTRITYAENGGGRLGKGRVA